MASATRNANVYTHDYHSGDFCLREIPRKTAVAVYRNLRFIGSFMPCLWCLHVPTPGWCLLKVKGIFEGGGRPESVEGMETGQEVNGSFECAREG